MLKVEDLRALSVPSGARAVGAIAFDWLLIVANFALAVLIPHPLVWAFCFVFSARQQLALAILMHDGAHRRLFRSARWNDYASQFFCSAPLFFSMYSYQTLHLKHHREPLVATDPDISLIGGYPISRGSFARKLLRDAAGVSYFKFIRYFIHMARKPKSAPKAAGVRDVGPAELKSQGSGSRLPMSTLVFSMLFMNFLIWLGLFLAGHGWYYLFLWVLPAVTALQVLLRIRGVAEHAGYVAGADQRLNARTVINPVQTFIFAPHNVNYHIEHHAYPAVPFYNLKRLHVLMDQAGLIPASNVFYGYRAVLNSILTK